MSESFNFYRLINLEDACPRRTVFFLKKIKGIPQYYPNKQIFLRNMVFEYLIEKFGLNISSNSLQKVDESFTSRFEEEGVGDLITNFETLINENEIELHEINRLISYVPNGFNAEIFIDGIGSFQGQKAIFKFNLTTRFNRHDALELVCVESHLRNEGENIERLIDLKLGSGEYREIFREGDLTKKGKLSVRGLLPWDDLKKEADELLLTGYELLKKMEADPNSYNIPIFGFCNTCPYHNVKVEFNGKKIERIREDEVRKCIMPKVKNGFLSSHIFSL